MDCVTKYYILFALGAQFCGFVLNFSYQKLYKWLCISSILKINKCINCWNCGLFLGANQGLLLVLNKRNEWTWPPTGGKVYLKFSIIWNEQLFCIAGQIVVAICNRIGFCWTQNSAIAYVWKREWKLGRENISNNQIVRFLILIDYASVRGCCWLMPFVLYPLHADVAEVYEKKGVAELHLWSRNIRVIFFRSFISCVIIIANIPSVMRWLGSYSSIALIKSNSSKCSLLSLIR